MNKFLKYGLDKVTGALVSVEDVQRGLKCDCICPECKSILIARQGEQKQWHFAHFRSEECAGARMTALHLWAQQIILKEKKIMLPPYKGKYYRADKQLIHFDDVFLEKRISSDDGYIQPDCIGRIMQNGHAHDLLIEILVTHEVDENKKTSIQQLNLACIEIDLSDLIDTDYTSDIIKERLLNYSKDRIWINSPVLEEKDRRELIRIEQEQREREIKERQEARERRRNAFDFVEPYFTGKTPSSTFVDRFKKNPRIVRDEIRSALSCLYYDSFFEPTDDDIRNSYIQAGLLEDLPYTFSLKEVFDDPINHYPTLIEYIDNRNDSVGRMFLFKTVLKSVYRQGYYVRYYSWDDMCYYHASDKITDKLDYYKAIEGKLSLEQKRQLERYVLVYCYDRIQTNIKNNKENLFLFIEKNQYWSVISCFFSLYLHHIVFSKLADFVQLTEYFLSNHIEYAHLYLKIANSPYCANNCYISAAGEDKLSKMSDSINNREQKKDLDNIVKFLFPEVFNIIPSKYSYTYLIEELSGTN